ncbi:MAG: hypothetical protein KGP12_08650 [Actinomycetales bacterium]|nr:hypothetical protein [Actinomycetales bacterium]
MADRADIGDHFDRFPPAQRQALTRTWQAIGSLLPGARAAIAYGMPTMQADGVSVVGLDGFTRHNSLFPYSGGITSLLRQELAGFQQTKGSIHFPCDEPFPTALLRRILRARIEEINAGYPRGSGESKAFYDNGYLKSAGRYKDGHLHGSWRWCRRDGSLMRTGSFRLGTQVGEWTTYDRAGNPVKVTQMTDAGRGKGGA